MLFYRSESERVLMVFNVAERVSLVCCLVTENERISVLLSDFQDERVSVVCCSVTENERIRVAL